METLSVTTPPALLAVPLDDAKRHLRVDLDFTDDDAAIESLIRAASDLVGVEADATLVETGYALTLDGFPGEGGGYWRRSIRQAGRLPSPLAPSRSRHAACVASASRMCRAYSGQSVARCSRPPTRVPGTA